MAPQKNWEELQSLLEAVAETEEMATSAAEKRVTAVKRMMLSAAGAHEREKRRKGKKLGGEADWPVFVGQQAGWTRPVTYKGV